MTGCGGELNQSECLDIGHREVHRVCKAHRVGVRRVHRVGLGTQDDYSISKFLPSPSNPSSYTSGFIWSSNQTKISPFSGKKTSKLFLQANYSVFLLFESLTAGLLHHRPVDPVGFVQNCLAHVRDQPDKKVRLGSNH